jgi:REP element-mobilizing transposase RayT
MSCGRASDGNLETCDPFWNRQPLFCLDSILVMDGENTFNRRARLGFHCPPEWVPETASYFITINCKVRGINQLANPTTAKGVFDAFSFYHDQKRWNVELVMIMPDHLHALMSFRWDPGNGMMNLIRNWKRYTSNHLRIEWQRDYFDHRIRTEADHQSTWFYIRENPVRAELVATYEEWPNVWRPDHGVGW